VNVSHADDSCKTGTHMVKYAPSVRGVYKLDVRLPPTFEIQQIAAHFPSSKAIAGSFVLTFDIGSHNVGGHNEASHHQ
jgi:hypothetical protein